MNWEDIIKAEGRSNIKFDDKSMYAIAQEAAKDLNLIGEDNYAKRFEIIMDDFDIDIEVSNVEQKVYDTSFPSETFAIRVKPEGKIELYDNELDNTVKVFTEKDIIIEMYGGRPKSMETKSGAFLFTTTYQLFNYDDGKIIIYVFI
tara:strand:+ start:1483 stop:1920 length:438 start_codon:yes stop_codon:yes gene_type:complete